MSLEADAYLIDLDGTIANTLPTLYRIYQSFLAAHGCKGCEAEFSELNGPSIPEVIQQLVYRHQISVPFADLYAQYRSLLHSHYASETPLFPAAREVIEQLYCADKRLLLVTSAERSLASEFLMQKGLLSHFSALITPEGLPRSKPDPAIYERALMEAALPAERCLAIEDSLAGLTAAREAGIRTIFMQHEEVSPWVVPYGVFASVKGWQDLGNRLEHGV